MSNPKNLEYTTETSDSNAHEIKPRSVQECEWVIGWNTPFFIIVPYLLALLIAIAHTLVFRYLDGKYEDDPDIPSQSQVTASATILGNVFGICIRVSLATTFTQYFWRIVRLSALRLDTIETLYTLRANPLGGLRSSVLRNGWLLLIIAAIMWIVPIATSFPPSAITVRNAQFVHSGLMDGIPSLNFSDTYGGNLTTWSLNSLFFTLVTDNATDPGIGGSLPDSTGLNTKPSLGQLAVSTMIDGKTKTAPSPCGSNCSYTIHVDAPYLSCSQTTRHGTRVSVSRGLVPGQKPVFSANWSIPADKASAENALSLGSFQFSNLRADYEVTSDHDANTTLHYTEEIVSCFPRRGTYEIAQMFVNGQQTSTPTLQSVHDLVPLTSMVRPPAGVTNYTEWIYNSHGNWGDEVVNFIRDANIMALIQAMTTPLIGSFDVYTESTTDHSTQVDDEIRWDAEWVLAAYNSMTGVSNGTIASSTPLFYGWNASIWTDTVSVKSMFNLSEAMINSLLMNITLSAISQYHLWPTSTNVTQSEMRQQYAFSRPLNLLLPYYLILAVVLPLVAIGLWALTTNGVAATDHGFLQILMTTRGSPILNQLAAGGCLGGDRNVPRSLQQLQVRFGEVRKRNPWRADVTESRANDGDIALASFGTEEEVIPLVKGRSYGHIMCIDE